MRGAPTSRQPPTHFVNDVLRASLQNRTTVGVAAAISLVVGVFALLEISYRQEAAEHSTVTLTGALPSSPSDRQLEMQLTPVQWISLAASGALLNSPSTIETTKTPTHRTVASRQPIPLPRSRPNRF
jgi:hypothetical protein